jgi:hypothetical protein
MEPITLAKTAPVPPDDRPDLVRRSKTNRSRVSNGGSMLPHTDGRSAIARRYHDLITALTADQGGASGITEARMQLIRRFAAAAVLAEQMESRLVNGEIIDLTEHATLSSTLVRLAQRIGINRIARDVTPSVKDYLDHVKQIEEVAR